MMMMPPLVTSVRDCRFRDSSDVEMIWTADWILKQNASLTTGVNTGSQQADVVGIGKPKPDTYMGCWNR